MNPIDRQAALSRLNRWAMKYRRELIEFPRYADRWRSRIVGGIRIMQDTGMITDTEAAALYRRLLADKTESED